MKESKKKYYCDLLEKLRQDLGVVEILGLENFEGQKECCEAEFVKELDLNEQESNWLFKP